MKRVVVDPISRIEGHLRVEIKVDEASGKVEDALSSGTAWRGIELVAKDRDPRDLWAFVQRLWRMYYNTCVGSITCGRGCNWNYNS